MCRTCARYLPVLPGVFLLLCCLAARADAPATPAYSETVVDDIGYVLSKPATWERDDWQNAGWAGLAVLGTAALLDNPLRDAYGKHPGENEWLIQIERLGAEYSVGVIGGFYLAGSLADNATSKLVAQDGLTASIIASGIITPAIKIASGRSRPYENEGSSAFYGLGANKLNSSFPSGHTTEAFALASVISAHYDESWIKYSAYGLASVVGFARVYHDAHFASDVLAGALIGNWVGLTVVAHHQSRNTPAVMLLPEVSSGQAGLKLLGSFQ
jgi:membrane-associated phospholipid phosphatase